jgi:hypothetical protein
MSRIFNLVLVWLALSAVAAAAAPAPEQSAEAFLHGIYGQYLGHDNTKSNGILLDKPSTLHRYFVADFADIIAADEAGAAKKGDVPMLDGDPFVDAQDWDITNLVVHIDSETADHTKATVTFDDFKEPTVVHYDLVHTPEGWRIFDIVWKEGSFRALYNKKR